MKNLILRYLNGKVILPLFILTGVIYTIMLAITIPEVMSFSGGMKVLDMMPSGYDAAYVNTLLNALGEDGRHAYLFKQIPFDMVFPLLFGISLCLVFGYILKLLGKTETTLFYTCLLPLISGLFDYCENTGIILILNTYPDNSDILALTTNIFSVLKSTFTTITFILLIVFLVSLVIRKTIGTKKKQVK